MANINRNNPTTHESGFTICDNNSDYKGSLIGESSYEFAGNKTGLAVTQTVAANAQVLFNSPSLLNLGSVFPGQPVTLTITATAGAATTLTILGYNDHDNVTETLNVPIGTNTLTSLNSYTLINSITTSGNLTNVTVGTNPLVITTTLGVKQPQLAASLDINSSRGAILYPKATALQIKNFDKSIQGITYASTDAMRVYNTTTNSFCEKINGYWSGLYLEDPIKPSRKKISLYLDNNTFKNIGNGTRYQILPPLPIYSPDPTALASSQTLSSVNTKVTLKSVNSYPASVTITNTGTGTISNAWIFAITGIYNGITFTELVKAPATPLAVGSSITTTAKFSQVTSIVLANASTGNISISSGYAAPNPVYVIYRGIVAFNAGSTIITGGGTFGLNFFTAADQTNYNDFMQLLTSEQLTSTLNTNGTLTVITSPNNIASVSRLLSAGTLDKAGMYLTNNGAIFNVSNTSNILASVFVTIEYDIVW